jgi:hypothetical protein
MVGLLRFPFAFLILRFKKPASVGWMPLLWADLECTKQDLPRRFWESTEWHRREFARLGFVEIGVKKARKLLNPMYLDNGGINYLDSSRTHFAQLIYNKLRAPPPINADRERVTVAVTAVFEEGSFSCSNGKSPSERLPGQRVVRVASDDVAAMYEMFKKHLANCSGTPRRFPDDDSLRQWFDSNQLRFFEDQVRRGALIRMTDNEVEVARRKLPPALPPLPGAG